MNPPVRACIEAGRTGDLLDIAYPYAHQVEAVAALDPGGDDRLRAVCWDNGVARFALPVA